MPWGGVLQQQPRALVGPTPAGGAKEVQFSPPAGGWQAGNPRWRARGSQGPGRFFRVLLWEAAGQRLGPQQRGLRLPVTSRLICSCAGITALGVGLPEEITRCCHGKVPPTSSRNKEIPGFNHFSSNRHLRVDQNSADLSSLLGNLV